MKRYKICLMNDNELVFGAVAVVEESLAGLSQEQIRRLEKMEELLLDVGKGEAVGESEMLFVVTGVRSVYTVKVNCEARKVFKLASCECADASLGAKFRKPLCKHACFVLLKTLGMPLDVLRRVSDGHRLLLAEKRAHLR